MNDFTASNGYVVRVDPREDAHYPLTVTSLGLIRPSVDALREFFQAEADERLGRWRWPEDPEWLVKYIGDHMVIVVRESEFWENVGKQGQFNQFHFRDARNHGAALSDKAARYKRAAWAFFEAHPDLVPKPWHDAVEGEAWVLRIGDDAADEKAWMAEGDGPRFWRGGQSIDRRSGSITAGRRIWPEVSS